jgi:hypothetical protein
MLSITGIICGIANRRGIMLSVVLAFVVDFDVAFVVIVVTEGVLAFVVVVTEGVVIVVAVVTEGVN